MRRTAMLTIALVLAVTAPAQATGPTAVAIGSDGRVSAGWIDGATVRPRVARAGAVTTLPAPDGGESAAFTGAGLFPGPAGARAVWGTVYRDLGTPELASREALWTAVPGGAPLVLADGPSAVGHADAAGAADGRVLVTWAGASAWILADGTQTASGAPPLWHASAAVRGDLAVLAGQPCARGCDVEVWTSEGGPWLRAATLPDTAAPALNPGAATPPPRDVALGADGRIVVVTPESTGPDSWTRRLVFTRPAGAGGFSPGRPVGTAPYGPAVVGPGFVAFRDSYQVQLSALAADGTPSPPVPLAAAGDGPSAAIAPDGRALVTYTAVGVPRLADVTAAGEVHERPAPEEAKSPAGAPAVATTGDASAAAWIDARGFPPLVRVLTDGLPAEPASALVGATATQPPGFAQGAPRIDDRGRELGVPGRRVARVKGRVRVPVTCRQGCEGTATIVAAGRTVVRHFALQAGAGRFLAVRLPKRARRLTAIVYSGRERATARLRIARRGSRGACGTAPWTSTIARSGSTRFLLDARGDGFDGGPRTVYACRRGRAERIAEARQGFDDHGSVLTATAAGSHAAVVTNQVSGRSSSTVTRLSTLDRRTRSRRYVELTSGSGGPFDRAFVRLALGADGTVAFLDRVAAGSRLRVLALLPGGRQRVLDAGTGIDPGRLTVDAAGVHWVRDGVRRHADVN